MIRSRVVRALTVGAGLVCLGALSAPTPAMAQPAGQPAGHHQGGSHGARLPSHVFAPYFEAYTTDSPALLARQSGAKFLTMAFLQTPAVGSCTAHWNGNAATPVSPEIFGADIARIRAMGGDVIPSFGGFAADSTGTELGDSCQSVTGIAAMFQKVITTYDVTRLDLDIEVDALNDTAGIDRRNKAITLTESWARAHGRTVQFVYTLPTATSGLTPTGLFVLQNAVANHARVDIVNIMTFDYYDNAPHQMATDTINAANALHAQLHAVYPAKSSRQLWAMTGVTEMIGVDDFGPPEIFTLDDARTIEHWATDRGLAMVSFWALQRDNGNCPGGSASDSCSGLTQTTWQFSHTFERFTR
jgi:hypothetical protein